MDITVRISVPLMQFLDVHGIGPSAAAPDVAAAAKPCRNGCEPVCVRSAAAG
jgi:hypothetical protein